MASSRLIIVPQYPAKLRYQEWYPERLQHEYTQFFDSVLLLAPSHIYGERALVGSFSPEAAIAYEIRQMALYGELVLHAHDVLLLCDISYPGMFASMLYHKRPSRCYALCHATSLNRYDLFAPQRYSKWRSETGHSRLFEKVFVASAYHQHKLGWSNAHVVKFPLPSWKITAAKPDGLFRHRKFVSVARPGVQKVNAKLENRFAAAMGFPIARPDGLSSWADYYGFLRSAEFLIVTSREETYGYQVIDALAAGAMPVAPKAMSYPEILPNNHLYEPGNLDSLVDVVHKLASNPSHPELWDDQFIGETVAEMCG